MSIEKFTYLQVFIVNKTDFKRTTLGTCCKIRYAIDLTSLKTLYN